MKKRFVLILTLLLCLLLPACGDSSSDDKQGGYETVMDMEFLDGMWSIDQLCCNHCTQYGHQYTAAAEERCPEYNIVYKIGRREYHRD